MSRAAPTLPRPGQQAPYMERARMLVLSTAHLSERTALDWIPVCPWSCFEKGEYGWFMYVCDDIGITEEARVPLEVRSAIHVAKREGCEWIMWDRDAPCIEELPRYEWGVSLSRSPT